MGDFDVSPFQDVGNLRSIAGRNATSPSGINFCHCNMNPGPVLGGKEHVPQVPFGNRSPGFVFDVQHSDHGCALSGESYDTSAETTRPSGTSRPPRLVQST